MAVWLQGRPASDQRTFGYQRAGVLAGFVNALSLLVLAGWIAVDAVLRLLHPVPVEPRLMMIVAAAGVVMNGVIAALLWRFSGDVNIRSVFVHMLGRVADCGDASAVDRSVAVADHCGDDPAEFVGDCAGDAAYSAGGDSAVGGYE